METRPRERLPRSPVNLVRAAQSRVMGRVSRLGLRHVGEARLRSAGFDTALRAYARDTEAGGGVLAAALAFRIFLFFIPYIFVVVATFDVAALVADESPQAVARRAGIGGLFAQAISASATHLTGSGPVVAVLLGSLVGVVLADRAFLKTLRISHGLIWGVGLREKSRVARPALTLLVVITAAMILNVGLSRLREASALGSIGATVIYALIPTGIWLRLSVHMPHDPEVKWRNLVPGAVLFGLSFLALQLFTVYWITRDIEKKSETYGAMGATLALLLWAYVLGRIMTASASLNASRWKRARDGAASGDH